MKNSLLITAVILLFSINTYTQCDNEDLINEFIESSMPEERAYASTLIAQCQLFDFIDVLLSIFEEEEFVYPAIAELSALESLNQGNIEYLAEQFLRRVDNMISDTYVDVLESKVIAARILIRYNNFSYFNFVTQIVDRDRPNLTFETVYCLLQVLSTDTQYIEYAKDELINLVYNADDYLLKAATLRGLEKHPDNDVLTLFTSVAQNDADWTLRSVAIDILLTDYYSSQQQLLRLLAASDPERTNRLTLSGRLLSDWGLPADLFAIIENLNLETDPEVITGLNYIILNFIPPRPTVPTAEMITNLIGYTDELYQYGWITEITIYNQYLDYLKDIEKAYSNKDKELLCTKLTEYSDYTESLHRSLLTEEGYKFMHYHGIYIKENVEKEFGKCE